MLVNGCGLFLFKRELRLLFFFFLKWFNCRVVSRELNFDHVDNSFDRFHSTMNEIVFNFFFILRIIY